MRGGMDWNLRISGVEGYIWDIYLIDKTVSKELSLWNKIKYLNLNIFRTRCCKPLIFQTQIIWSNRIHTLKYLRYATFDSKDIVIRKSEFAAKTQFLYTKIHKYAICIKVFVFNSKELSLCHKFSFIKPISLQPYDENLWYFKLTLFDLITFIVWNIKGLRHWVATILK